MKLVHLSDLHIGKKVHEVSMLDEQKYILGQILSVIDDEKPDVVMIAGDVYDKSIPPAEAVEVFDEFLVQLAKRETKVMIISGNHDSPERLAFGNRLFSAGGIYISPVYDGNIEPITLNDSNGEVNFYLLPFIKPFHVRTAFPDETIESYTDAVNCAVKRMNIDTSKRNVLLSHQFVTGSQRCDSEDISVGGSDNVDASVYDEFDYVALGHLHGPQDVVKNRIRYCGTPLKYSFSEVHHKKSVTVVELGKKGELSVHTVPLTPQHDMVIIRGKFDAIMQKSYYENTTLPEDYLSILLTDEQEVYEAKNRLKQHYKNILNFDYADKGDNNNTDITAGQETIMKTPFELFFDFYKLMNNQEMTDEQQSYVQKLIEDIQEGEE